MLQVVERDKAKAKRELNRPNRDLALVDILKAIEHLTPKEVAERGGYIGASTVANWRAGNVRCPLHYTLTAAAKAVGMEYRLEKIRRGCSRRETAK